MHSSARGSGDGFSASVDAAAPGGRHVAEDVTDAVLSASRALMAVAARSLAGVGADVTLPQYRAMIVLASRGPQRVVDLSAALDVAPSTGTRMCDRLVRKSLARRQRLPSDRRAVRVTLTEAGRALIAEVSGRRRVEIIEILGRMSVDDRAAVVPALRALSAAAGEVSDQDWPTDVI